MPLKAGTARCANIQLEGIVQIDEQQGRSISLTAIETGEAELRYTSTDGEIYATCRIVVRSDEDEEPVGITDAPVFIAFGPNEPVAGWNSFIGEQQSAAGSAIMDLIDQDGNATGVSITITEPFNGRNGDGVREVLTEFNIPIQVATYSYYGNSGAPWQGKEIKQSTLVLAGLDASTTYDFCFFGSRRNVSDNRETRYIVKGAEEKTASINTSNNASDLACVQAIKPTANGTITIVVTAGPNNNNGNGFFYLNAMRILRSE